MKISNLILTLALALFISFALTSQSNSNHIISIINDDGSLHIEYKEGKTTLLKVDGETIDPSDYSSYQNLIDNYRDPNNSGHYATSKKGSGLLNFKSLVNLNLKIIIHGQDLTYLLGLIPLPVSIWQNINIFICSKQALYFFKI